MAYLNKEYKYVKEENFENFLKIAGLRDEQIPKYLAYQPSIKLVKDGDTYTYTTTTAKSTKATSFKLGDEFEDEIQNFPFKTSFQIDGNTVTQTVKSKKGEASFKREYNGDDLIVSITSPSWDGVAKRFYKA